MKKLLFVMLCSCALAATVQARPPGDHSPTRKHPAYEKAMSYGATTNLQFDIQLCEPYTVAMLAPAPVAAVVDTVQFVYLKPCSTFSMRAQDGLPQKGKSTKYKPLKRGTGKSHETRRQKRPHDFNEPDSTILNHSRITYWPPNKADSYRPIFS
jgi:hypothetical protein